MCEHILGSGQLRYDHSRQELTGLVVCDGCGEPLRQTHTQAYTPAPKLIPIPRLISDGFEATRKAI
jgi:hypothetical protein